MRAKGRSGTSYLDIALRVDLSFQRTTKRHFSHRSDWVPRRAAHPPEIPVTGERKSVKILDAIELWTARFHYGQAPVFNASTYLDFLHRLAPYYRRRGAILIQDNASYHKDSEVWSWFKSNRHWLEVHQLPPYSPELNPTERLWQYTRQNGTHDRYFASPGELVATLSRVFGDMQSYPELIRPRLLPFC